MNVLIIGAGDMGRGMATRLAAAKAAITLPDVDAGKAEALAAELRGAGARCAGAEPAARGARPPWHHPPVPAEHQLRDGL